MLKTAVHLIGRSVSDLLACKPLRDWPYKRSTDEDSGEELIYLEFKEHGLNFILRDKGMVTTAFFDANGEAARWFELPTHLSRAEVRQEFGTPESSGEGFTDSVLGEFGPHDRFEFSGYLAHFEFLPNEDRLKRITLMMPSVAPGT